MARGEKCFDVVGCRYVNIKSYDRYRNLVLKSREYKDARIEAAEEKRKIEKESESKEDENKKEDGNFRGRDWKKER